MWPWRNFDWRWEREPKSVGDSNCVETFDSSFQRPWMRRSPCSSADRNRTLLEYPFDAGNVLAFCGSFQYVSSFDPHCATFACYRPVQCRSFFYEHKFHRWLARVCLPVSLWRRELIGSYSKSSGKSDDADSLAVYYWTLFWFLTASVLIFTLIVFLWE